MGPKHVALRQSFARSAWRDVRTLGLGWSFLIAVRTRAIPRIGILFFIRFVERMWHRSARMWGENLNNLLSENKIIFFSISFTFETKLLYKWNSYKVVSFLLIFLFSYKAWDTVNIKKYKFYDAFWSHINMEGCLVIKTQKTSTIYIASQHVWAYFNLPRKIN